MQTYNKLRAYTRGKPSRKMLNWWMNAMCQDPLFRNQDELVELLQANISMSALAQEAYGAVDNDEGSHAIVKFQQLYLYPSIQKVFGIKINNWDEGQEFLSTLERNEREEQLESITPKWSLQAPEKPEDFWRWFNEEGTGKPMPIEKPGHQSQMPRSIDRGSKDKSAGNGKYQ